MATKNAKPGDMIFIPWGSRMPVAVRRNCEQTDHYQLIGLCCLHVMMYGNVLELEKGAKIKSEDIYLV